MDERGGGWVEMSICDAGPGLPKELLAHPFQRFALAPGKRRREGSGLGLSIVRVLTEAQGGNVTADEIGLPVEMSGYPLPCGSTAIWQKD